MGKAKGQAPWNKSASEKKTKSRVRPPRRGAQAAKGSKHRTGANCIGLDNDGEDVNERVSKPTDFPKNPRRHGSSNRAAGPGNCPGCDGNGTRHGLGFGRCGLCWGTGYKDKSKPPELRGIHRTIPEWTASIGAIDEGLGPLPPGWQEDFDDDENAPFYWHDTDPDNPTWERPRFSCTVPTPSSAEPPRSDGELEIGLPEPEFWTQEHVVCFLRRVGLSSSALEADACEDHDVGTVDCRTLVKVVQETLSLGAERSTSAHRALQELNL